MTETTAAPTGSTLDTTENTFPYARGCPFAQPDEYKALRDRDGLTRVPLGPGGHTWLATRYEDVRAALTHPDLSSDRRAEGYPSPIPIPAEFRTGGSILSMDPPEHTSARRLVAAEFTFRRAQELRPRIQQIVDESIDDMIAAGPLVDLHTALGARVTMSVITEMLGITLADQDFLQQRTRIMFGGGYAPAERRAAMADLDGYFVEIVRRKHAEPRDDLISRLIAKHEEPLDIGALATMTRLLLNGGHDSTASMISLGILTLLQHPDQKALLAADPALAPKAVEELLRFLSVADLTTPRVATRDIEVGGTTVAAGAGVTPSNGAANRDGAMFDRPDELDVTRGSRNHLAFGHGRHLCLGAEIARTELEVTFTTVLRRLPGLRIAVPFEQLRYRQRGLVFGLEALPVTW